MSHAMALPHGYDVHLDDGGVRLVHTDLGELYLGSDLNDAIGFACHHDRVCTLEPAYPLIVTIPDEPHPLLCAFVGMVIDRSSFALVEVVAYHHASPHKGGERIEVPVGHVEVCEERKAAEIWALRVTGSEL